MTNVAFDSLKAAEALAEAGIEERHAKAIASTMHDAVTEGVATKADIAHLDAKIDSTADKLLIRLGGLMIAIGGLILAAIAFPPSAAGASM